MSRILRRPMFRGGKVSSYGNGIASGLANGGMPNKRGLVDGPGGYAGEIDEYQKIVETVRDAYPGQKGLSVSDYLRIASGGLEILGAPSEGGGIGGVLATASKPLAKLGQDLAKNMDVRKADEEESVRDISAAILKGRSTQDRGFALGDKIERLNKAVRKKQQILPLLDDSEEGAAALTEYIKINHPEVTDAAGVAKVKNSLKNELQLVNSQLKVLLPKDEYTLAFLKSGQAGIFFSSIIAQEEKAQNKSQNDPTFNWSAVIESAAGGGMAQGGRVSYAEGGITDLIQEESVVEEDGMPVEETMMTEEVTEQPSASITFEELRARLPKEIPDEVVKLISSSDQALLEFSNIATQQDVDEFNVKYGVELVLPQV